jgi:mannose/fructose/N-acetylgalactosamine-specific phosphotransferase system component IIC
VIAGLDPPAWGLLALLGALLALDEMSLAQTWLSQPLPAALLAGTVVGQPAAGVLPGILLQLVVIGNLPVGAAFRLDASSATLGLLAGALTAGGTPPAAPLAAAAWTGTAAAATGALVVGGAAASVAGGWLVHLERQARLRWMLDGYRSVRDGELDRLERLQLRCLLLTALRGAVLTVLWAGVAAVAWRGGPAAWPPSVVAVLALVPWFVPALAAGSLLERFGPRRALPWVGAGAAAGVVVLWWQGGG